LEDVALVSGTQQNLSNLYSLDIFGNVPVGQIFELVKSIVATGAMLRSSPWPALPASQHPISPIFYEQLFVQNLFAQLFCAYNLGL
jgi:hypothetical protein